MIRIAMAAVALGVLAACQPAEPPASETGAAPQAETAAQAAVNSVTVDLTAAMQPAITQKLKSPLTVEGVAPARWYFEAVFPVKIEAGGKELAAMPGQAQDDWTNGNPTHLFKAELTFSVTSETAAELVFEQDMPDFDAQGNDLPSDQIRIPVTLVP